MLRQAERMVKQSDQQLSGVTLFLDDTPVASAKRLPGESEEERDSSGRLWRTVIIGDQEQRIDMQVIRQYLRVVTHGGKFRSQMRVCSFINIPEGLCACVHICMLGFIQSGS